MCRDYLEPADSLTSTEGRNSIGPSSELSSCLKVLTMPAYKFLSTCHPSTLFILLVLLLFPIGSRAQLLVDCLGSNPNEYPSINAALQQAATVGSTILVTGTCTETVNVFGMVGLNLGALP